MKKFVLLLAWALCSCTVVNTEKAEMVTPWPKEPACTLVNNTRYALEVYRDGQQATAALEPGQVLAVPGDKSAVAVIARTKDGELVGSAFHHYWFRGEVWVLTTVTRLNED